MEDRRWPRHRRRRRRRLLPPAAPPNSVIRFIWAVLWCLRSSRQERAIFNSWFNFLGHVLPEEYDRLRLIFLMFAHELIDLPTFELKMILLLKYSPDGLKEFKRLLPTAASPSSTFNDRVRDRLYDDTECYCMWLDDLIDFNLGHISFLKFREAVEPLFAIMPDLWEEFDSNFGYTHGERANTAAAADAEN